MFIYLCILVILFILYFKNKELYDNIFDHSCDFIYSIINANINKNINTTLIIVDNKKYYVLKNDTIISNVLRCGIPWEKFMHKYFINYKDLNMNALDIGANIGTHTIYLAENFKTVYAFEPQKKVFKLLKKNIKLNNISNIITYNYGLGNKESLTKMREYDINKKNNIGAINIDENGTGEEIEVKTLDSFNLTNIKLIKMDVEGYEYFVLLGGINTILQSKPIIIIELNNCGAKYRLDVEKYFKNIN